MIRTRPNDKGFDLLLKVGRFIWKEKEVKVEQLLTEFHDRRAIALAKFLVKQGDFLFDGGKFYAIP